MAMTSKLAAPSVSARGGKARLEAGGQRKQFFDLGDDAGLFGERRKRKCAVLQLCHVD
jgi:hypothetical protein